MNKETTKLHAELVVAGGGIAGMCAAVAAARHGVDVILINDRSVLGGNASSEIGVGISGANHQSYNAAIYAKECGLPEEIRLMRLKYNENGGYDESALSDAVFFDFIYNEKNIRLMMNTLVEDCTTENGMITSLIARHEVSNEVFEITAHTFVDATGNGILAYAAGADFRFGREGKAEHGEYWAPEVADDYTMGDTILFETVETDHEVIYTPPAYAYDITKLSFFKDFEKPENFRGFSMKGSHWTYEFGGQVDILKDHNDIEYELRRLVYGIWDYIKNSGRFPQAKNRYLKTVFPKAGKRESRRFLGDYILTENDIEQKINFEDSVAMGGWPMDVHAPLGIYDSAPASNFVPVTGNYNIPYRCLYSRNVKNLFLAGRDISVTHIALGTTRVMATCGAEGQAVGTAAYLCRKYNILPREVGEHMEELQKLLLADDQSIIHRKDGVAEGFTATASSEMPYENTALDGFLSSERDYCLGFMCAGEKIDSIELYVSAEKEMTVTYRLLGGEHPETFLPSYPIAEREITLPAGEGWVRFPIGCPVSRDGKLYLVIPETKGLRFGVSKRQTMGAITYRMHSETNHEGRNHDSIPLDPACGYAWFDHHYEKEKNLLFRSIEPAQHLFAADQAINGYTRPYGKQNLWMPAALPATLTLTAEKPVHASALTFVFDNDLHHDEYVSTPHPTMARDYRVTVVAEDGSEQNYDVRGNFLRSPKLVIKPCEVKEIRLTVTASYGAPAGVYGLRVTE